MEEKRTYKTDETFLAKWIADEISDKQLKEVVSDDDFIVYQKIKQGMEAFEKPSLDVDDSYKQNVLLRKDKKEAKVKQLIPNWLYSAAALLIIAFGVFQFFNAELKSSTDYGLSEVVHLNEGTTVTLNAKSEISYPKYQEQRNIELLGEAFFEVTKKGDFSVMTKHGSVQVLGTKFNVISQDDFFEVVCYEGKVNVSFNDENTVLTAGQAWRNINGRNSKKWKLNDEKPSWLKDESSFKSVPIKYVLIALEKQYNIKIDNNSIQKDILFTGSFTHNNLDKALHSVCLPLGFDFTINQDKSIVLVKK